MNDFDAIEPIVKHRHVEIRLGNYCNYKCSFCDDEFKLGDRRALSLDDYKRLVDNLVNTTTDTVMFSLQGGETTLWPPLGDFLSYIKYNKGLTQIFSNGSRTLRWWEEFLTPGRLDRLIISHHAEQNADPKHTEQVMKLAASAVIDRYVNVTTMSDPILFEKTIAQAEYLRSVLPGVTINLAAILFRNTDSLQHYTPEQLSIMDLFNKKNVFTTFVKNLFGIKLITKDKSVNSSSQAVIYNNKNRFNGWDCNAGSHRLVIEIDEAYTGICRVGGVIGRISEGNVNWLPDSIKCDLNYCTCGADLVISKRRPQ
jgi:organic radical activating enzyme